MNSELEIEYGKNFQQACNQGDVELALKLVKEQPDLVWYRDEVNEDTPLHYAAKLGNVKVVKALFYNRHPWNLLNKDGLSCGDVAEHYEHFEVYQEIVEEGIRAELILSILQESQQLQSEDEEDNENNEEEVEAKKEVPNQEYLDLPLKYSDDKLLDFEDNGVMMGWEGPLMKLHAEAIAPTEGLHVLNIGFGLGLIDEELQLRKPASHTIVEAHPDVYAHMLKLGWDKKPNVRILFGRWQDQINQISDREYDGIFFDTFGEYYQDLKQFHEHVPNILNQSGTYSFFNGLGGDVKLFHDVYCRIAEIHLKELGLDTKFDQIEMDPNAAKIWDGVKRRYWQLKTYHLPTCTFDI